MKVIVYTRHGRIIKEFEGTSEVIENDKSYLIVFEDDRPRVRVYGKEHIILIQC